jgi:hypothetical protein
VCSGGDDAVRAVKKWKKKGSCAVNGDEDVAWLGVVTCANVMGINSTDRYLLGRQSWCGAGEIAAE